ncbi:MAG TPA: O-antigen ligase family protein [Pyrinomonadaceae bacterium]|nr:O-antigen ligase family protein [Pyrinomonadaceae bacterium]
MEHELENSSAADLIEESSIPERFSRLSGLIFILLCVVLIFSTLAYGAVETWAFGFISVFTGLIAVFWLADAWFNREIRFDTNLLQIPVLGLVLIGIIQLLPLRSPDIPNGALSVPPVSSLSINPYATRLAVIQLIIYAIFLAAAFVYINSAHRLRKIVTVVIIFGAIMAFFGILQRLASPDGIYGWRPTPQAIPFASFVNQHHFAAFMEMTIGLTLALLVGNATEKDKRLLLIIAIVLMGIAILLTGSRGGVLSLLGVIGFVLLTNVLRKKKDDDEELTKDEKRSLFRRNLAIVGGGLGLLIVLFGAVLLLGGDVPLSRGIGFINESDVSNGRLHFWTVAVQVFKDYPILGAGLDSFGTAFPHYDSWNGNFRVEQAHNDYLQTLADAGILGFICIAAFVYLLFKQGLQKIGAEHSHFRRSVSVGAMAGCLGILIHSFFDFPLRTPSNAFFFLLFAVFATASIHFSKRSRTRGKR